MKIPANINLVILVVFTIVPGLDPQPYHCPYSMLPRSRWFHQGSNTFQGQLNIGRKR